MISFIVRLSIRRVLYDITFKFNFYNCYHFLQSNVTNAFFVNASTLRTSNYSLLQCGTGFFLE